MDTLKDFIDQHKDLFDAQPLEQGHQERFLQKLHQAAQNAQTAAPVAHQAAAAPMAEQTAATTGGRTTAEPPVRRHTDFRITLVRVLAVAASLVLIAGAGLYFFSREVVVSPCAEQTHLCYIEEMQKLSKQIDYQMQDAPSYRRQEIMQTLATMVPDGAEDPFAASLPQELSESEREILLSAYYLELYNGVKEIAAIAQ